MSYALEKTIAVVICLCAMACNTDASITRDATGLWSWKPREVLAPDKIVDRGFPTPTLEAMKLDADGHCTFIETEPGYDVVPEYWLEYRGTWSVDKGKLTIDVTREWGAAHRGATWTSEPTAGAPEFRRTFEVTDHDGHRLRLHTEAIGDYDRDLRKAAAMPQRLAI